MSEVSRIRHQLRYAMEGPAWHGPALEEILSGLSASQAARVPEGSVHSAWQIVLHITAWLDAVRVRLGGESKELTNAEDWPRVTSHAEAAWSSARAELRRAYDALHSALGTLSDDDLDRVVTGRSYNMYFMLHGVIQHTLYHGGQVMLLKRLTAH